MTSKIYAIYDHATEAFGQPFFTKSQGQAIRSFRDECENKESQFNKHAKDFDLFYLGEYNEDNGQITQTGAERVARATDFVITGE